LATELDAQGLTRDVPHSAVQYVQNTLGLQVCAVTQLADLLRFLQHSADPILAEHLARVQAYRDRYGVS
jgi:orotate phosphoribosyltransferase